MERNTRKTLTGTVVSDVNNKTISVSVDTFKKHPLYGKRVRQSKKYAVHDENNTAKNGDIVRISECRPLSAKKRFRLVAVKQKAANG